MKYLNFFLEDDAELEHIKKVTQQSLFYLRFSSPNRVFKVLAFSEFSYVGVIMPIWALKTCISYVLGVRGRAHAHW